MIALTSCSPSIDTQDIFDDPRVVELADAACRGDALSVRRLLHGGAPLEAKGKKGVTPLVAAIACGNSDGVRALIEAGAQVNVDVEETHSPLKVAVKHNNLDVVLLILEAGADIYYLPKKSRNNAIGDAFDVGFATGDWTIYEYFLKDKIDINRPISNSGKEDIVAYAASLRRYDKVLELLENGYGGDINKILKYAEEDNSSNESNAKLRDEVIARIGELKANHKN